MTTEYPADQRMKKSHGISFCHIIEQSQVWSIKEHNIPAKWLTVKRTDSMVEG